MELKLAIEGLFDNEQELRELVLKRKICYDSEPYYFTAKKGALLQIGFQLNLYGTLDSARNNLSPDSPEYDEVERDLRRVAEVLTNSCGPLHMCKTTVFDSHTIAYSAERKMRPDVTVHVPIFNQKKFGQPVDDQIRETLHMSAKLLETVGVQKTRWHD
jgi:hypothetical protein